MIKNLYIILFAFTVTAFAQSERLTGQWMLTKAEIKGQTVTPYQIFEFKPNGKLLTMGVEVGAWSYDKKANTIILKSKMDKDFNGQGKVVKLTPDVFIMNKGGDKYYYSRVHPENIAKNNKAARLAGKWKLAGSEYPFAVLKLDLPDNFTLIQSSQGETDTRRGTWIFVPEEQAIIFISFSHLLRGKIPLSHFTADGFTLQTSNVKLKARRITEPSIKIERLTFTEDDFPEDAEPDASQLPWREFEEMADFLNTVVSVQYSNGSLLPELNLLKHTDIIVSKVRVDITKPSVRFTNFTVSGKDSSQFSENFKGGLTNNRNAFFPQEEPWPYRIAGVEKITVPAGTFTCTVIEAVDGDKKLKYWMINDMPGIYAKIIIDETDPFGKSAYTVRELEKINYKAD